MFFTQSPNHGEHPSPSTGSSLFCLAYNRIVLPGRAGAILAVVSLLPGCASFSPLQTALPYEKVRSVVYDNDEVVDVYTDEYVMALAAAGDIHLNGLTTSSSVAPYNRWVTPESYERMVGDRSKSIDLVRGMGWSHIPDPIRGPNRHLERPSSDRIEDTQSISSAGSWLVVHEAKKATPATPLVLVMGGPLTLVADAYLLDPSIADRVVVMWLGGRFDDMADYNGWADPWSAYIVLQRLSLVQFPVMMAPPFVPKQRLASDLPESALRNWMIKKQLHTDVNAPGDYDGDGPPAIAVMRSDYVVETKRVSFSHWERLADDVDPHEIPVFKDDPQGKTIVVTKANAAVATEEWWRALRRVLLN